jgi:hypothetical protein
MVAKDTRTPTKESRAKMFKVRDATPRKHRNQMRAAEINFIELCVGSAARQLERDQRLLERAVEDHAFERMLEKGVSLCEALECLKCGYVVELKANGRVVMRHDVQGQHPVCVVFAVRDRAFVTGWKNYKGNIRKADLSPYQWNVDSISFIHSLGNWLTTV